MTTEEIKKLSSAITAEANEVIEQSSITKIWEEAGCKVNLVGSLRMGLLGSHRDIDFHVYSRDVTTDKSFAVMAKIAADPRVIEIKCINGLTTDEHCIAWHVAYKAESGMVWQIDIIHIEEGTQYDGFFERMADRIIETMTPLQKETILRLKLTASAGCDYHGVEYYEAVIADGVSSHEELKLWIADHRQKPQYYWIP